MTREEAIRALECRLRCDDVIYVGDTSYPEALSMAIEALKAHEQRVMTLEETKKADYCWLETKGWVDGDVLLSCLVRVVFSAARHASIS